MFNILAKNGRLPSDLNGRLKRGTKPIQVLDRAQLYATAHHYLKSRRVRSRFNFHFQGTTLSGCWLISCDCHCPVTYNGSFYSTRYVAVYDTTLQTLLCTCCCLECAVGCLVCLIVVLATSLYCCVATSTRNERIAVSIISCSKINRGTNPSRLTSFITSHTNLHPSIPTFHNILDTSKISIASHLSRSAGDLSALLTLKRAKTRLLSFSPH